VCNYKNKNSKSRKLVHVGHDLGDCFAQFNVDYQIANGGVAGGVGDGYARLFQIVTLDKLFNVNNGRSQLLTILVLLIAWIIDQGEF